MQPYCFPYVGYFQLVHAVDTFVFFNDVNFIKKGWINRNRLLQNKKIAHFTIPLKKQSQNKKINEIQISDYSKWKSKFFKTLHFNYRKAPHYDNAIELLGRICNRHYDFIHEFSSASVVEISQYLGMKKRFVFSDELGYEGNSGTEKILSICRKAGAEVYINSQNGRHLYKTEDFGDRHVELQFLEPCLGKYRQFSDDFFEGLSIIDILMFNSQAKCRELLLNYTIGT